MAPKPPPGDIGGIVPLLRGKVSVFDPSPAASEFRYTAELTGKLSRRIFDA